MLHLVYNALLPATCTLCDSKTDTGIDLCRACFNQLPHNHRHCKTCALPLHSSPHTHLQPSIQCGNCLANSCIFDEACIPFLYRPPADFMVHQLKFSAERKFARLMGELLAGAAASATRPDLLVPVPVHRDRYLERGFNQASSLASVIGKRLNIPVDTKLARRVVAQTPQAGLNARQRRTNVRGAFEADAVGDRRHIAIIDDVLTTRATGEALAKALKKSGCQHLSVWAFARTP
jgi:ComF family protein